MNERFVSDEMIKQAHVLVDNNAELLDADKDMPLRKDIQFGLVEAVGNYAHEILLFERSKPGEIA